MKRVEELTLALADGAISDAEQGELDGLLAADPDARRLHLATLEMELGLRGRRARVDVAAAVMAEVEKRSEERVLGRVMADIAALPRAPRAAGTTLPPQATQVAPPRQPARATRARATTPRWSRAVAITALAASFLVVIAWRLGGRDGEVQRGPAAVTLTASLEGFEGAVTIQGDRGRRSGSTGARLEAGDSVETGEGASARLRVGDSLLALGANGLLRVDELQVGVTTPQAPPRMETTQVAPRAPRLHLERGTLAADVARESPRHTTTFATPHARAIVLGTRLRLAVTPVLTRLDVDEGEVVFERLHDGARVHVSAGRHALSSEGDAAALRAAASTEGRATAAATAPAPARVLAFNFEDGVLPPAFYNGELGVAPPRPGNRHAVMGGLNVYGAHTNTVALGLTPAVAYHAERLVLAFDYWLGADGRLLEITMFDSDRHQNYSLWLDDVVTEAWGHAEVRLVDLKPHRRKVPMEPGDRILNILIKGGRMGGKPFFVDNIELYEASTDRFGRRSTAGGPARLRSTP